MVFVAELVEHFVSRPLREEAVLLLDLVAQRGRDLARCRGERAVGVAAELALHHAVAERAGGDEHGCQHDAVPGGEADADRLQPHRASRMYPAPRMVWMSFGTRPRSTMRRSRPRETSIRLEKGSNSSFQTCSAISSRPMTRPAFTARYSSSAYSFVVTASSAPPRVTRCERVSMRRSATSITGARGAPRRRRRARRRARSSANSKGLTT